jgi:hypothetical protein
MKICEHDCVVLTSDFPHAGLESGDVGTVIHVHGNGDAFEVEFMTLTGETVAIATVSSEQLRPVGKLDVSHVRELAAA